MQTAIDVAQSLAICALAVSFIVFVLGMRRL